MMKYVVRFCLILFILGTLVACGGNTASEPTNPNPDTSDALSELIENENAGGNYERIMEDFEDYLDELDEEGLE
jgi:hypothetical protein